MADKKEITNCLEGERIRQWKHLLQIKRQCALIGKALQGGVLYVQKRDSGKKFIKKAVKMKLCAAKFRAEKEIEFEETVEKKFRKRTQKSAVKNVQKEVETKMSG